MQNYRFTHSIMDCFQCNIFFSASKQMVYEVYKNVVGTLEEFESRIADKTTSQLQRSMRSKPEFEVRTNNEVSTITVY